MCVVLLVLGSRKLTWPLNIPKIDFFADKSEVATQSQDVSDDKKSELDAQDTLSLKVELSAEGRPKLTWLKIDGAQKYRVYRSLYEDEHFIKLKETKKSKYVNQKSPLGLDLYYRVKAFDSDGNVIATSKTQMIHTNLDEEETLKTRYIATPKVKLHKRPDSISGVVALRYMDQMQLGGVVIDRGSSKWYRAFYNDKLYYLLVKGDNFPLSKKKSTFEYSSDNPSRQAIIDTAMELCLEEKTVYVDYDKDGILIENGVYGFNCSGFVTYTLNAAMQDYVPTYEVPSKLRRLSAVESIYNDGYRGECNAKEVDKEDMQPGDVLFFRSQLQEVPSDDIGHCGIYMGNNEFVHCTGVWDDSVCIMPLRGPFKKNLLKVMRFVPKNVQFANEKMVVGGDDKKQPVYTQMYRKSEIIDKIKKGDEVRLLFTDSDKWAYVKTEDGDKGFMLLKYLK